MKLVSHLDRSELMHHTTHTVLRNLTDGVLLVTLILFLFLGNVRSALIVAITIPFSLLFAAILLDAGYLAATIRFMSITRAPDDPENRILARQLLKVSVIYLPLLLLAMMLDAKGRLLF